MANKIWQNRIIGYFEKPAKDFQFNPQNWRIHGQIQRDAISAVLSEIGWVTGVVENITSGNLLDGHARIEEALKQSPDTIVPFLQVNLTLEEETIKENGLFDYVVLDSVINSVKDLEYEHFVLLTCSALLASGGTFYMTTRKLGDKKQNVSVDTPRTRGVEFLDGNNFSRTFRDGLWTGQRFHTKGSLTETLLRYFDKVEISVDFKRANQLRGICSKPKQFSRHDFLQALEAEFNPDYMGFKHNKYTKLLEIFMLELEKNGRIYQP